jgi:hypothetical protein
MVFSRAAETTGMTLYIVLPPYGHARIGAVESMAARA